MTGKKKYILIILMAIFNANVSAQNSQVVYYMNLPQNHLINPALRPSNSVYIGLPAISGINININNNFINFSDVFMKGGSNDSIISFLHPAYDINDFLSKIKDKNSLEPEVSVQLFGLGFSVGKGSYVFFDINERVQGNIVLPGDLLKLAFTGNEPFVGKGIDLSSFRGDLKYYREAGLGFSKIFTDKLRIGVKGKLLFGIAGVSIDNKAFGITVNENYTHTLNADLTANLSGPLTVNMDADKNITSIDFNDNQFNTFNGITDFVRGKGNIGLGFDVGATYDINDELWVSASLTDIGYIKWGKDVTNLKAESRFEFSGLNIVDVINGTKTFEELGTEMLDSLKNSFNATKENYPFKTNLPFGVTLGGSYNLTKRFSVGLLSYSRFIGRQMRESLTMSANVNIGNAFSTSLSYTAANHRLDNIGAGFAFRTGIFQFYLLSDRIPVMWNKIKIDKSTVVLPTSWNTINLRFGMNLAFGNRIKKKDDKPMIIVE